MAQLSSKLHTLQLMPIKLFIGDTKCEVIILHVVRTQLGLFKVLCYNRTAQCTPSHHQKIHFSTRTHIHNSDHSSFSRSQLNCMPFQDHPATTSPISTSCTDKKHSVFYPTIIHPYEATPKKRVRFDLTTKETPQWYTIDSGDPEIMHPTPEPPRQLPEACLPNQKYLPLQPYKTANSAT